MERRQAAEPGTPLAVCAALLCLVAATALAQSVHFDQAGVIPQPADIVRLQGDHAYLVLGRTLTVFDVSNPAAPRRVGAYTFPDKIWGVKLIGKLLYAAVDKYGLGILDVSNTAMPVLLGSFKTPGQAKSVAIVDRTALVADHMAGVNFIDISNPAKPASRGSFFLDGYARAVAAIGSIAAAVDAPTGLYVFDLSKPDATEPISVQQTADRPGTVDLSAPVGSDAPTIAALVGAGTLQIYDVSNPEAPVKGASFRTPSGRPQRVALEDKLAYVADGPAGLQIVDLSTPSTPRVIGGYKTSLPARDVTVAGSLVLVAVARAAAAESAPTEGSVLILRRSK